MKQILTMMGIGMLVLGVLFTLTWLIQRKTKNAGIVDTLWSASFPILTLIYFISADGYIWRKILITTMVIIWGARLAIHLFIRTIGNPEDERYTTLRKEWGNKQQILMLRFFYFQAALALVLSLPFALIMVNGESYLKTIEIIGGLLWMIAVTGESIADFQLKKFKANPMSKGKVCEQGLWNYSRHPNYFFEWLVWVSFFVTALGSAWGILSIICPLAILYFLLKVTGIPYTEAQSLRSKGPSYEAYKKTTSSFVPLPKKKGDDAIQQRDSHRNYRKSL